MRASLIPPFAKFTFSLIFVQTSHHATWILQQFVYICQFDQVIFDYQNTIFYSLSLNIRIKNPIVTSFQVIPTSNNNVILSLEIILTSHNNIVKRDQFLLDDF